MCNHRFCKQCIKDHIEGKINEAQVSEEDLTCPYDAIPIDINIIKANTTQIIFEKLITFRMNRIQLSVNDDEILFRCPGSPGINCQFMGILQRILEEFQCPSCLLKCCPKCLDIIHKGCSCEAFKQWKEENNRGDDEFKLLMQKSDWVACP